jgi:hypothetical protein
VREEVTVIVSRSVREEIFLRILRKILLRTRVPVPVNSDSEQSDKSKISGTVPSEQSLFYLRIILSKMPAFLL